MFDLFKNKIEKLAKQQTQLELKKQKIEDRKTVKIKTIENKIRKLKNKTTIINQNNDDKVYEINRIMYKNEKQIKLEKEYYNSIGY